MPEPDLSSCDTEPVHIPGSIQPQGALLVVRPDNLLVVQASANLEAFVGMAAQAALGRTLAEVLGQAPADALLAAIERYAYAPSNVLAFNRPGGDVQQARVHRSGCMICVELEPAVVLTPLNSPISTAQSVLASLTKATNQHELFEIAAREIRQLTGYDRVMIYRFDPDRHGEVVAEARAPHLKPFLGMHYPATDIPLQARRMFLQQRVRLIADVYAEPVPMLVARAAADDPPLDMTYCTWRSVSPVHLEYLHNMGVGASCSIALSSPETGPDANGEPGLWGLIACHHDQPYWMNPDLRASVDIVSQVLSLLLGSLGDADIEQQRRRQSGVIASLGGRLATDGLLVDAVAALGADLLGLVAADGAVLRIGGEVRCFGRTPGPSDAARALAVLSQAANGRVLALDNLTLRHPDLAACQREGCGVLLQPLSRANDDAILWFRPEQPLTVVWAGNPDKLADPGLDPGRLTPRKSFEAWKQVLEGRSRPWTQADLALAGEAQHAVAGETFRRLRATLQGVEDRLGFALSAASLGTWEIDPAAGTLHASAIMSAQFGLPADAALTCEQMLGGMQPDDRAAYLVRLARSVADDSSFNAQFRARRPDGSERWIEHRGRLLRSPGRPPTLTGIALDITGRKQIETELARYRDGLEALVGDRTAALQAALGNLQAEVLERESAEQTLRQSQKMEAVGQLTGGIAHDFNNLLTIISISLEMMQAGLLEADLDEAALRDLTRHSGVARRSISRATALTQRLLAFARMQVLSPQAVDINAMVTGMEDLIVRTMGPAITLRLVLDGEIDSTFCDVDWQLNSISCLSAGF
nr:GAF domain-containing protein [uncultured Lichenicoccus sp.]